MKQLLKIGNVVDDGTGDYLREGGQKINSNFEELYTELGDGSKPHSAGAWKTIQSKTTTDIVAEFGKSYAINTDTARVAVKLPKGNASDYNKVIRIRDVFATWQTNPVTIIPASGNTIKGEAVSKVISTNYADLELVYCSPGRWEYIENKQVNRISNSDLATVVRKEFIAKEGQVDFLNVFDGYQYNKENVQVYRRGNLLYYGAKFSSDSDYGSPGANNSLVELDGINLRMRTPCRAGDTIIVVSYMDGIAQWRSTYNRLDLMMMDQSKTLDTSVEGARIVGDLSTLRELSVEQFGYEKTSNAGLINPNTLEVYVNGVIQYEAGKGGMPMFICDGYEADGPDECIAGGGEWISSKIDYVCLYNPDGSVRGIEFGNAFDHGDIVTIKWYNNNIGTTLEIDEILEHTNEKYFVKGQTIDITGAVRITDYDNPAWPNVEREDPVAVELSSPTSLFNLIYPIGTIYENAVNPNNPSTYMGFGTWKLWGEKRVTVGWTSDSTDTQFGLNNNDLDSKGVPNATAGGTGGNRSFTITNDNLPKTQTDESVLIVDKNGTVVVGGCQFDPDEQGAAYSKYREERAITNNSHVIPKDISVVQPYVTVYRWLRIS